MRGLFIFAFAFAGFAGALSDARALKLCQKNASTGVATAGTNMEILHQNIRKIGKLVTAHVVVKKNGTETEERGFFTLPAGFRPTVKFTSELLRYQEESSTDVVAYVSVHPSGLVINDVSGANRMNGEEYFFQLVFLQ